MWKNSQWTYNKIFQDDIWHKPWSRRKIKFAKWKKNTRFLAAIFFTEGTKGEIRDSM